MSYLLWERRVDNYSPVNERTYPHYTPRCEIKDLRNINNISNLIHRPEEVLDIQSELIFVTSMPRSETLVHQQLSLHQLHHPHPAQQLTKQFFLLHMYVTSHVQYTHV